MQFYSLQIWGKDKKLDTLNSKKHILQYMKKATSSVSRFFIGSKIKFDLTKRSSFDLKFLLESFD